MFSKHTKRGSQSGSTGNIIWIIVGIVAALVIKAELFPGIKNGSPVSELVYRFGEPIGKETVPRPG